MKIKNLLFMSILSLWILTTLSGCFEMKVNKSSADWAYSFVVFDGYIYKLSNEYVNNINEEIGKVTSFSNMEGTYTGNFSNEYEKGTKYYSIMGVSTEKAIAIQEENGKYRKAIRDGKYEEK